MRALKIAILMLVLGVAAAAFAAYRAFDIARTPYRGYTEDEIFFTVQRGRGGAAIATSLEELGVVRDRRLFLLALRYLDRTGSLQAGEYRFAEPHSIFEVIERLAAGDIYTFAVNVPEGLTLEETADHLARQGLGDLDSFLAYFEDGAPVAELDPDAESLEGYLFPTTYQFTRNVQPGDVARTMVAQFKQTFDATRRARAKELDLTLRQVVTLASVIEKETGDPVERPIIGSVFWNRIKRGMPLQSDPTVIYALKLEGRFDGNLRRVDLELESPYNTYRYPGIPPGPIASPGEDSIDAVLEPASTSYLYFVSKNDGTHHFSSTYSEHLAAVRKYQVEYFRRKRQGS